HVDLGIEGRQLEVLLVLLRAIVAAGEGKDQWIVALDLTETAKCLGMVGQLEVREAGAGLDIGTHGRLLFGLVTSPSGGRRRSVPMPRRPRRQAERGRGSPGLPAAATRPPRGRAQSWRSWGPATSVSASHARYPLS